jgi:hypothetical protein
VCIRGNNIGAGERLCRNSGGIGNSHHVAVQATRPKPPTCTVAADLWRNSAATGRTGYKEKPLRR